MSSLQVKLYQHQPRDDGGDTHFGAALFQINDAALVVEEAVAGLP